MYYALLTLQMLASVRYHAHSDNASMQVISK